MNISIKTIPGFMIIVFLSGIRINGFTQDYQPGYFIDLDGDTSRVQMSTWSDNFMMQFQVKYLDAGGTKREITPKQAREIHFQRDEKPVKMISLDNTLRLPSPPKLSGLKVFLMIDVEGYLSLFEYHSYNIGFGLAFGIPYPTGTSDKYFILKKGNEGLFFVDNKKKLIQYLSDCPNVALKIKGNFRQPDVMKAIVHSYNEACDN